MCEQGGPAKRDVLVSANESQLVAVSSVLRCNGTPRGLVCCRHPASPAALVSPHGRFLRCYTCLFGGIRTPQIQLPTHPVPAMFFAAQLAAQASSTTENASTWWPRRSRGGLCAMTDGIAASNWHQAIPQQLDVFSEPEEPLGACSCLLHVSSAASQCAALQRSSVFPRRLQCVLWLV